MAYRISAKAEDDLDDIWLYIAAQSDSPERADRQIAAITERFYLLADHPFLGRSRPDFASGFAQFSGWHLSHSIQREFRRRLDTACASSHARHRKSYLEVSGGFLMTLS